MPTRWSRVRAHARPGVLHVRSRASPDRANATWRRRFPSRPAAERRAIAAATFAHFGRLLFELLKFSTLSPEAMLARVEFDGEERAAAAYAQGKGVLFFTGHFGFWELHAIVHALRIEPIGVLARALDNARLNSLLEQIRQRTGNTVIYRQGTIRRVMRTLQAGHGVGDADRSAHAQPRRDLRGFLRAARGDDVGGGGAGAAHRRAGRAGVRAAARPAAAIV